MSTACGAIRLRRRVSQHADRGNIANPGVENRRILVIVVRGNVQMICGREAADVCGPTWTGPC